jgi:hypothetical protein
MRTAATLLCCFSLALFAFSAMAQDRPTMTGTWQLDAAKSDLKTLKVTTATWVIEEGDNTIHIAETEGAKSKKVDLQCTTDGKECQVTGDKAKASFWYNGPMLVEMETKGDRVTRYRLKVSDDGKTLTVEMTHIVPQIDKIDTMVFGKT